MSARTLRFEKWEGLGNDFVVVEGLSMTAELCRRLCDRRLGIGADGVLVVTTEPPRMEVWNADGSRPEMCGNGLRCVAAWLMARGARGDGLTIATDAGERRCHGVARGPDRYEITVDMGRARMTPQLVVEAEGRGHRFHGVDVGNPHAITFEPYSQEEIDRIGPRAATAPEGGTNVEFCLLVGSPPGARRIEVVVWERGVGRTQACGTGACAAAAAACELGMAPWGEPIEVALPGGDLVVSVAAGTRALTMRGPARRVFTGEVVIA